MRAGDLDRRITIRRNTPTTDDFGQEVPGWADLATVWASKQDVRDSERFTAAATGASLTTRFQIRWSSALADLSPEDQLVCEGRTYSISAVKEIGRRVGLEITAAARVDVA